MPIQQFNLEKLFVYRARDHDGKGITGYLRADSAQAAARYICGQGYYVIALNEQRVNNSWWQSLAKWQGISAKKIMIFCRQLAIMIHAGLPLSKALNILQAQAQPGVEQTVFYRIYQQVKQGESFSNALRSCPKIFPPLVVCMVEAGELGGILAIVLNRLATHLEKEYLLTEKIKAALVYPLAVISLAVVVVGIILTIVMPIFVAMFASMTLELPLPTRLLLDFSAFWDSYGAILLLVLAVVALLLRRFYLVPQYRRQVDWLILKLPLVGKLSLKIAVARFTRTLGTLLNGGVPLTDALRVVTKVLGNLFLAQATERAQQDLQTGLTLAEALAKQVVFEPMVIQMIAVGEETGQLAVLLDKIADFYEADSDAMVARLSSLLEPVLIVILGIVVGGIVMAIALPMFESVTQVMQ